MVFDFFSPNQVQLTEPASITLIQQIQQQPIVTPLQEAAIATTYVRQGNNQPPLLLLHGFDSSVLEFRRLLPLLAEHHKTWSIDLLGFGFTERPPALAFDPAAIKTHLYYTWKTLIGQPMVLVGASMGGAVAIDFALTYPEAVQQLVLIDSAGLAKGPAVSKWMFPPLGYLATEFLRQPRVRRQVSCQAYFDPQQFVTEDALRCAALHLQVPNWRQALIAFTKSGGYTFSVAQIAQIQTPTLILWGDADRILGTKDADALQGAIAQSQLVWIPDCGHVPHLEKPQATAAAILSFITT